MGRPKLLLPWGEATVLGHLLKLGGSLRADQIVVVHASGARELEMALDGLNFPSASRVVNPDPNSDMAQSLRCAARWPGWRADLTHWAIALGDQPHLELATWVAVRSRAAAQPEAICQPVYQGKPKHPVFLPRTEFRRLAESTEGTLKDFLRERAALLSLVALEDPGLNLDLDTPVDYERALKMRAPHPGRLGR